MALKLRMRQQGRNNKRVFRLVVTDTRNPRDGKYLESIGWYDPSAPQEDKVLYVKPDRAAHWLDQGVEMSDRVKALLTRGAPEVIRRYTAKQVAQRQKMIEKRRKAKA